MRLESNENNPGVGPENCVHPFLIQRSDRNDEWLVPPQQPARSPR